MTITSSLCVHVAVGHLAKWQSAILPHVQNDPVCKKSQYALVMLVPHHMSVDQYAKVIYVEASAAKFQVMGVLLTEAPEYFTGEMTFSHGHAFRRSLCVNEGLLHVSRVIIDI